MLLRSIISGLILCFLPFLFACGSGRQAGPREDTGPNHVLISMKPYLAGIRQASPWLILHSKPQVGQWWQKMRNQEGSKQSIKRSIVLKAGSRFVIEEERDRGFILAYLVDPRIQPSQTARGNVLQAWIGEPGKMPKAISIQETENYPWKDSEASKILKYREMAQTKENQKRDFSIDKGLNFDCHIFDFEGNTITWSEDGWFDGVLASEIKGTKEKIIAAGNNAQPALNWDDVQITPDA